MDAEKIKNNKSYFYKKSDKVAYFFIGVYSGINALWIIWAFYYSDKFYSISIFDTVNYIGFGVPIMGLLLLIVLQNMIQIRTFSLLANVFCITTIILWFFAIWNIIATASASV